MINKRSEKKGFFPSRPFLVLLLIIIIPTLIHTIYDLYQLKEVFGNILVLVSGTFWLYMIIECWAKGKWDLHV